MTEWHHHEELAIGPTKLDHASVGRILGACANAADAATRHSAHGLLRADVSGARVLIISSKRFKELQKRRCCKGGLIVLIDEAAADSSDLVESHFIELPKGVCARWSGWDTRILPERRNMTWKVSSEAAQEWRWHAGSHITYVLGIWLLAWCLASHCHPTRACMYPRLHAYTHACMHLPTHTCGPIAAHSRVSQGCCLESAHTSQSRTVPVLHRTSLPIASTFRSGEGRSVKTSIPRQDDLRCSYVAAGRKGRTAGRERWPDCSAAERGARAQGCDAVRRSIPEADEKSPRGGDVQQWWCTRDRECVR